jgi:hypothetical protein
MSFHWDSYREEHQQGKSTPGNWRDPPPLDESLANQLVATVIFLLKQNAQLEEGGPSGPTSSSAGPSLYTRPSTASFNVTGAPPRSPHVTASPSTSSSDLALDDSQSIPAVTRDIMKSAGKIIFYVSASNWNVVFAKLRSRLVTYAGQDEHSDLSVLGIGVVSSPLSDVYPCRSDVKLLEFCSLNRTRLGNMIQGKSNPVPPWRSSPHT